MEQRPTIVGLGEALFDLFPDRRVLGGAPLNVAVHAHQLSSGVGGRGVPASRVGRDELGRSVFEELGARGVPTDAIQVDDELPTGRVVVTIHGGEPEFEILRDAAWDRLEWTDPFARLAEACDAVCFGTLAQRDPRSRLTVRRFVRSAGRAIRLFDVNLRRDGDSEEIIRAGCELATVVKLTDRCAKKVKLSDRRMRGWKHRTSSLMIGANGGGCGRCS